MMLILAKCVLDDTLSLFLLPHVEVYFIDSLGTTEVNGVVGYMI